MKKIMLGIFGLAMIVSLAGCSGAFWGGTAAGAGGGSLAAGGAYELNAKKQANQIKKDLDDNKISQEEYNIRKDQIQRMSIFH